MFSNILPGKYILKAILSEKKKIKSKFYITPTLLQIELFLKL